MVGTSWVDSVFVGDDFPEFSTNLVTALTGLEVDNFSHLNKSDDHLKKKIEKKK